MKFSRFIIASLCIIGLAGSAWSDSAGPSSQERVIPGYVNPQTGVFTPSVANSEVVPPAATTFTGTFIVKFSITVKSAIATTTPILCQVE